jgi:cytochrome P450 PksS
VGIGGRRTAVTVTRFDECQHLLLDERLVKDRSQIMGKRRDAGPWVPKPLRPLTRNMLDLDGPDHRRLRGLVQRAFTPNRIRELEPAIETLAEELLQRAIPHGGGPGTMDLIEDYAAPIPSTIIAGLLGVPSGDWPRFRNWSDRIVAADGSPSSMLRALPSGLAFLRYIRRLVATRRAAPREDLVSALMSAESDGDRLDEDELVAMIFLLLVAGHETTIHLIGNGMIALLENPEQLRRLRAEPDLMESAVEELLRYAGPLLFATERYASRAMAIAGVAIERGELVLIALASANRDEAQFPHADELILDRDPNRHLAFGHGVHFCLGAALARLEARFAFSALLARVGDVALSVHPRSLRWRPGLFIRGTRELPLRFSRVD